jgi:hypothetical protein
LRDLRDECGKGEIVSDALTDIARDERREEYFCDYIEKILSFLEGRATQESVVEAARTCDVVPRGYWGGKTSLAVNTSKLLDEILANKKETWAWILHTSGERHPCLSKTHKKLKALSPWPQKQMKHVSFGSFQGGLSEVLEPFMHEAGNGTTFGGNPSGHFEYVVFFDKNTTLLQIAESAVCINIKQTSWAHTGNRIVPTSHRLDYLRAREKLLHPSEEW